MRDVLHSKLDLFASRLRPYAGFIFLCGGPTEADSAHPLSVRDAIFRELRKDDNLSRRLRVAEDFKDWSRDGIYKDLVLFEQHIAALSSVIVLVVESPGSIAELGLFSVIADFQRKLLVVLKTSHYEKESFIRLGPVDFLEKTHENLAECHRWSQDQNEQLVIDEEVPADLGAAIRRRAETPTPERILDCTNWIDRALLLCELLNLCAAMTLRELRHLFEDLGFPQSESDLRQMLFMLLRMGLIAMEPKGDQRFFVGIHPEQFVQFHLRDQTFDISRFRTDALLFYEKHDRKRHKAILEVRARHGNRQ